MNAQDASSENPVDAAWPSPAQAAQKASSQRGQVAVDIFEFDNYYIVKAPIAGVKLSDIDIEITDNVLTIRGERKQSDDIPQNQYYLQECYWGEFNRSITLPFNIDPKKVKATFNKECILKILIPKEEKVKIVRISE
jgi:HSP20 family protein